MKWHISSWLFAKLDDFQSFVVYSSVIFTWQKMHFLFCWYTTAENENLIFFFQSLKRHVETIWSQGLIKSSHYIVPSPSTALVFFIRPLFICIRMSDDIKFNSWKINPIGHPGHFLFLQTRPGKVLTPIKDIFENKQARNLRWAKIRTRLLTTLFGHKLIAF